MPTRNKKIKLSDNLKLGIAGPSSQGTLFKVGGVFFLAASLVLAINIFHNIKNTPVVTENAATTSQVLGAFDQAQTESTAQAAAAPKNITYTVQKGDTLFNIAQNFNINWVVIASANNLKAPYQLKPGTVLQIPQDK